MSGILTQQKDILFRAHCNLQMRLSSCMGKSKSLPCLLRTAGACVVCVHIDIFISVYLILYYYSFLHVASCSYIICAYCSQSTDMQFALHRGGVCQMHIF